VGGAYPNPFLAETEIMVVTNEDQWVTAEFVRVIGERFVSVSKIVWTQ